MDSLKTKMPVSDLLLDRYLADELSAESRAALEERISQEKDLKERVEELKKAKALFFEQRPSAQFAHRLAAHLDADAENTQKKMSFYQRWWFYTPSFAAAAGLIFAVSYTQMMDDKSAMLADEILPEKSMSVPAGQVAAEPAREPAPQIAEEKKEDSSELQPAALAPEYELRKTKHVTGKAQKTKKPQKAKKKKEQDRRSLNEDLFSEREGKNLRSNAEEKAPVPFVTSADRDDVFSASESALEAAPQAAPAPAPQAVPTTAYKKTRSKPKASAQGGRTYAAAPSPSRSRSVAISASAITLFVKNGSNKSRVKNGSVIAHGAKLQLYWKGEVRGQWVLIARTSDKKIHIIGKGYKSSGSARLFSLPNALLFGTAVDLMLVENVSEGGGVHNISQALASGGVRGQWRVRLVAAD